MPATRSGPTSAAMAAAIGAAAITAALLPAAAQAHPQVDRGHELLAEAEFDEALEAFERAQASGELDREELLELLEGRVMAHVALGQQEAVQRALRTLAAVDPGHELGPEVPPEVRAELARLSQQAGKAPSLEVRTAAAPDGLAVQAEAADDEMGVVERVLVHARVAGGSWREGEGRVVVPAAAGDEVEHWAEAVGPGGAVLVSRGSDEEPLRAMREPEPAAEPVADDEGGPSVWLWVGIGAAVAAVAAGVGAGVALAGGGGSSRTQPELPVVMGF